MNKKLSSVVAALGLMAAVVLPACSETGLSVAPERPTLPSPEIELTSIGARTCIAEIFRALANPELLCPHPLEGEDIPEEDVLDAQIDYDDCVEMVPETEATLSDEVITLFRPFLPNDFDFSGPHAEVQSRIANAAIPLTLFASNYGYDCNASDAPCTDSKLMFTPGFIEMSEINTLNPPNIQAFLRDNNIAYIMLETGHIINPNDYFYRTVNASSIYFSQSDNIGTLVDYLNIRSRSSGEVSMHNSLFSDVQTSLAITTSIGECIERDARRIDDAGEEMSIMHLE